MSPPDATGESYDAIPYDSLPLRPTHPSNLALVAHLAGLEAPRVGGCRVLELGCASGGNLLPMAIAFPASTFVGIDLSAAQIDDGRRTIQALGLPNVTLSRTSIMDIGPGFGTFDYIISHGVYSWVPPAVQDKMLEIMAHNLSPTGVAYVSYNTYPGWHLRGMVRDMLRYHVRGFDTPQECIEQARAFLSFLVQAARDRDSAFAKYLGEEADVLREAPDSYLFHEHLEIDNRPCYFHEFVERALRHGLEYLGEALPSSIKPGEFSDEVERTIRTLAGDVVKFEQYLDFLRNRMFRRSLLCHRGRPIDRSWNVDRLDGVHIASAVHAAEASPDLTSDAVVEFEAPGPTKISASHPWLKAAFGSLGATWPEALVYGELEARVGAIVGDQGADEGRRYLRDALMRCYVAGILELHLEPYPGVATPGPRPLASPLARLQASTGGRVATLRHTTMEMGAFERHVLALLDGTRDQAALACLVSDARREGLAIPEPIDIALERCIEAFARGGLLLA